MLEKKRNFTDSGLKAVEVGMVDVPRFELGASSMPRKRASKLRHTPSVLATYDAHLSGVGHA